MNVKLSLVVLCSVLLWSCGKETKTIDNEEIKKEVEPKEVDLGELSYVFAHKSVMFDFTSTGCPGCGSWGKPTFKSLISKHKDKIVPIAVHIKYGDPMITGTSDILAANRTGSRYTPQIWVNSENAVVINSNNYIDGEASVKKVDSLVANASATSGVGLGAKLLIKDNKAFVKYGVNYNASFPQGDYSLTCYLLENGIAAEQQTSSSKVAATHDHVIRQAAEVVNWGKPVAKADDKDKVLTYEHTFNEKVKGGQYVVVVLWQKIGETYYPINALEVK